MNTDHTSKAGRNADVERSSVEFDAQKPRVAAATDEVFGDIREGGPNYRNVSRHTLPSTNNQVGRLGAAILILKSQIGLGVLSLPNALGMLGIVPGILCLLAIAGIMTWSGYVIAEIKLRHKRVCESAIHTRMDQS